MEKIIFAKMKRENNKYMDSLAPHLEARYGATKANAVMERARKRFGELCSENADEPTAWHIHPKLIWGRTQTLGKGGSCCDFKISIKQ